MKRQYNRKIIIKGEEIVTPNKRVTFESFGLLNPCTRVIPSRKGKHKYNRSQQKKENRLYM